MKIFPLYLLPLLLLLCGCTVDVDYTGQKFPVDNGNYNVKYFKARQELDLDKYAIIGRFVVTAPARTDHYAFQKILMEKERSTEQTGLHLRFWKSLELFQPKDIY